MEKKVRIDWKTGMDITPEVFINSDNYHISERSLLGRFLAFRSYGILPELPFHIEKNIENNCLHINNLECLAITGDGYIINIQNYKKELKLNEMGTAFYVVLTVNPYLPPNTNELSDYVEYGLVLKEIDKTIENGIPVLKIIKNNQGWEIDETYIPPAISLNAVTRLKEKFAEINNIIHELTAKIPEEDALYWQCVMLNIELNNYTLQEEPKEFLLLMKKFCRIFQEYLKTVKNIESLPSIQRFMNELYNNLEIGKLLQWCLDSLEDIKQKIEEQPVEEPEEEIFEIKV